MKHGAWSVASGRVTVSWSYDGAGSARLSWVESDGPEVALPTRRGFGHVVVEGIVAQAVGGEVNLEFRPAGLSWSLSIPDQNLVCPGK